VREGLIGIDRKRAPGGLPRKTETLVRLDQGRRPGLVRIGERQTDPGQREIRIALDRVVEQCDGLAHRFVSALFDVETALEVEVVRLGVVTLSLRPVS
jgi:hypothetical protein